MLRRVLLGPTRCDRILLEIHLEIRLLRPGCRSVDIRGSASVSMWKLLYYSRLFSVLLQAEAVIWLAINYTQKIRPNDVNGTTSLSVGHFSFWRWKKKVLGESISLMEQSPVLLHEVLLTLALLRANLSFLFYLIRRSALNVSPSLTKKTKEGKRKPDRKKENKEVKGTSCVGFASLGETFWGNWPTAVFLESNVRLGFFKYIKKKGNGL